MIHRAGNVQFYCLNEHEDGMYLSNTTNFVVTGEQAMKIGKELIRFAKKHKADIDKHNKENELELEGMFQRLKTEKKPKQKKNAYVYVFRCGEHYKVGYSKDVSRRIKELDNRPYNLDVLYTSPPTPDAYEIEKKLHEWLEEFRIEGEWYNFPDYMVEQIVKFIEFEVKWEAEEDEIYD